MSGEFTDAAMMRDYDHVASLFTRDGTVRMTAHDTFLDAWTAAERDGDTATTDGLLTGDFVGIEPLGFVLDTQAWLLRHADGLH